MMIGEGQVESMLPGGLGRVRSPSGEEVLIAQVAPGEMLRYRAQSTRRGVLQGELLSVLRASPMRQQAPCACSDRCGGCALQHLRPPAQVEIKSEWVRRALRHVWQKDTQWSPASVMPAKRRRVRWHLDEQGRPGFHARRSRHIVHHRQCMVLEASLNALLVDWPAKACAGATACQAVALSDGIHAILEYPNTPRALPSPTDLPSLVDQLPVQWWWRADGVTRPLRRPARIWHDRLPTADGGVLSIGVGPDDFVQGHAEGNRCMIRQILDWCLPARRVVDFFAGIGNLSLPLAMAGCRVDGFESNPASVRAAKRNAAALEVNASYWRMDLHALARPESSMVGADVLLLDPPRKGAKRICRQMRRLLPAQVVMVHCDLASAARDAGLLAEQGYRLRAARALDLFPYSGHVECMSLWRP